METQSSRIDIPLDIWYTILEQSDIQTLNTTFILVSTHFKALVERNMTLLHKRTFLETHQSVQLNMRRINTIPSQDVNPFLLSVMHSFTLEFSKYASGRLHFTPTYQDTCELTSIFTDSSKTRSELQFIHTKPMRPVIYAGELMYFEMIVYRFARISANDGGVEKIECVKGEMDSVAELVELPNFTLRFDACCQQFVGAEFSVQSFMF